MNPISIVSSLGFVGLAFFTINPSIADTNEVVVHSSRMRKLDNLIFKSFSIETGVKVRLVEALGSTLVEKSRSAPYPPDVVILVGNDIRKKAVSVDLFYSQPSLGLSRCPKWL